MKIDRPTVYAALRLLLGARHVRSRKIGVFKPTGLDVKGFSVTPHGIVALLQAPDEFVRLSEADLRVIAQKNARFLPLVFGKWEFFTKRGQEALARHHLFSAVGETTNEVERLLQAQSTKPSLPVDESLHRRRIYTFMFLTAWLQPGHLSHEWLRTLLADEQILSRARREALSMRVELKGVVREVDKTIRVLRKLGPPTRLRALLRFEGFSDAIDELYELAVASDLDEGRDPRTFEEFEKQLRFSES